ncbi:MAG: hypothetical protein K0R65_1048 [Crocinitomicaceae bacterium]|jgi:hypothetical protein|nr:hypothetical protein [Crocinitomicaceae bacterium]
MKKILVLFMFLLAGKFSQAQLISGELLDEGRKLVTPYTFTIKGKYKGIKYFELAVNREGKVTGVREEVKEDSFVSSPAKMIAEEELRQLQFEAGTYYPKFQQVLVRVEFVRK